MCSFPTRYSQTEVPATHFELVSKDVLDETLAVMPKHSSDSYHFLMRMYGETGSSRFLDAANALLDQRSTIKDLQREVDTLTSRLEEKKVTLVWPRKGSSYASLDLEPDGVLVYGLAHGTEVKTGTWDLNKSVVPPVELRLAVQYLVQETHTSTKGSS